MHPGTRTKGPADRDRGQQQQSQLPAFSTRSRNDTRSTGTRVVQIAAVPARKSASDAPACAPVTEEARPGPGRWS